MAITARIIEIGDELVIALQDEALAHLKIGVGDILYLVETPEALYLTPDQHTATMMQAGVVSPCATETP